MNSISTKIKLATLIGIATLAGTVLYVKADRTAEDESMDASFTVKFSPTTNLNAVMKATPRANEYTSSEYSSKIAPSASGASEYLALYENSRVEDFSYQDNTGGYSRRKAPTTIQGEVPDKGNTRIEGQRAAQSNSDAYASFGVRSAVVKNDTIPLVEDEEDEEEDPRLQIITGAKQRVVGVDSYSSALKNAEANDNAYQVDNVQQGSGYYSRYKVRSADRGKEGYEYAETTEDGYAKRRAPQQGTNAHPVKDYANSTKNDNTYEGYNVRSAKVADAPSQQSALATTNAYTQKRVPQSSSESTASIAQINNAKDNDKAYKSNANDSNETYGGYAVRSSSNGGKRTAEVGDYSRRRAPKGTNESPVKDYANSTKPRSADTEYQGYAVKSAGSKTVSTAQAESNDESYGGYAVRSAGKKSATASSKDMASSEDGYARRRAPMTGGQNSTSLAQYENASKNDGAYKVNNNTAEDESYGGYAVRSAGKKTNKSTASASNEYNRRNTPSQEYAQGGTEESYGGYAVRSAGRKNTQQASNYGTGTTTPQKVTRAKGGVPASTGLKVYGSRGERLTAEATKMDRSVIVMPKRGRSVAGIVVQDEPGKSIIVQSSTGTQSTYRYGEIDALVNL